MPLRIFPVIYRACAMGGGTVHIHSGYAHLMYSKTSGFQVIRSRSRTRVHLL
jgi:hypothetical protein